jgi:hypothetical protein
MTYQDGISALYRSTRGSDDTRRLGCSSSAGGARRPNLQERIVTVAYAKHESINKRWMVLSLSLGALFLLVAIGVHAVEPEFWPEIFLHLAAGLALSAVLFYFDRKYEEEARETRENFRALRRHLDESLVREDQSDRTAVRTLSENASYQSLRRLLDRAAALGALPTVGVRGAVPESDLFVRVSLPDEGPTAEDDDRKHDRHHGGQVLCTVEHADRVEVARLVWKERDAPAAFLLSLRDHLSQAGYAGTSDDFVRESAGVCAEIAGTLAVAIDSRVGAGHASLVGKVFQRINRNWYVTTAGLENIRDGRHVDVEQLRTRRPPPIELDQDEIPVFPAIAESARQAWHASEWTVPLR